MISSSDGYCWRILNCYSVGVGKILLANSFYAASGKEYHKLPACSYCTDISEIASCTFYKGIRQQYQ